MQGQLIHRASGIILIILSSIALLAVASGFLQPPQTDEGVSAHIFQLSIAALLPTVIVYFATSDWKQPFQNVRPLIVSAAALAVAFGALYYLERFR